MKNLILILFILPTYFISAQNKEKSGTVSSSNGKEFVLDYYQKTFNNLQKDIKGLSQEQMQFKASPESWSISQCVEHMIVTEKMIFDMLKEGMKLPANPERRNEIAHSDEEIIAMVTDRSEKYKAPEMLQMPGKYNDPETALKDLENQRKEILEFIKNTSLDELRNHINDSPAGATDAYQSLLFLAGHTARHTLQVEEVKASPNFPKK